MPVSGLLLTLDPADEGAVDATLAALAADPRVTLGPREGHHLAIALDTPSRRADQAAWEALYALPAVTWIDLVHVSIDPNEADDASEAGARHGRRH